jgi:hypothetical protein
MLMNSWMAIESTMNTIVVMSISLLMNKNTLKYIKLPLSVSIPLNNDEYFLFNLESSSNLTL